jgi:hypothetical protein
MNQGPADSGSDELVLDVVVAISFFTGSGSFTSLLERILDRASKVSLRPRKKSASGRAKSEPAPCSHAE